MDKQNEVNGTASEPIARYDELPVLRTYKVALENIVQIGGFWAVGLDKVLYHIEMPDKVGECMWKDAKRYDIQTGKVVGYTNYDRFISKTTAELAEWIAKVLTYHTKHAANLWADVCDPQCPLYKCCNDQPHDNIEDWLKSPVEVDNET